MAIEDDDKPRKKISHEIGQDLSLLSVEELSERIALLTSEIERLQAAMTRKRASKDAANNFSNRDVCRQAGLSSCGVAAIDAFPLRSEDVSRHKAGMTGRGLGALGQWPTWQMKAEEIASFTIR